MLLTLFLFQIEDAQVQDTGRYTCEATNVAGKTEKNYNVNIWGKYKEHLSNKAASLQFAFTDCVSFFFYFYFLTVSVFKGASVHR